MSDQGYLKAFTLVVNKKQVAEPARVCLVPEASVSECFSGSALM